MKTSSLLSVILTCTIGISYGQWTNTDLSVPRAYIGATSLGSKAYFAGGMNSTGLISTVEIYNISTGQWDPIQNLSDARVLCAATTCGSKIFFAGGVDFYSTGNIFSTVDIFDTVTGAWYVDSLSVPRFNVAAMSYDNKVLFAGGVNNQIGVVYDVVDVYDIETGTWSVQHLPGPRSAYGGVVNNLAILPGGFDSAGVTKRVDIYNFSTGTWSEDSLSVARAWVGIATLGSKMLIAGGVTNDNLQSDIVDIYDTETGTWDTAHLSLARSFADGQNAVTICGKAYFVGGGILNLNGPYWDAAYNRVDIYDLSNDSWSVDSLRSMYPYVHRAAVPLGDQFLVAGGLTIGGAYKTTVEIYTCPVYVDIPLVGSWQSAVGSYPNPFRESTIIEYELEKDGEVSLMVYNQFGQQVAELVNERQAAGEHRVVWDASGLPSGIYYLRLATNDLRLTTTGKLVKIQ